MWTDPIASVSLSLTLSLCLTLPLSLSLQAASSPPASPAVQRDDASKSSVERETETETETETERAVTRSEMAALQQQLVELAKDNAELLEAKLLEGEGRVRAERVVRELQEKLGRATAKNATMAEVCVCVCVCVCVSLCLSLSLSLIVSVAATNRQLAELLLELEGMKVRPTSTCSLATHFLIHI